MEINWNLSRKLKGSTANNGYTFFYTYHLIFHIFDNIDNQINKLQSIPTLQSTLHKLQRTPHTVYLGV